MVAKVSEAISRIRNQIKSVNIDAFVTDRYIFSLILKHVSWLVKREDDKGTLRKYNNIFHTLDYFCLIDVDKADTGCFCIESGCTIKRSKDKIPPAYEGSYGPIIRSVTSIDGTNPLTLTYPSTYQAMVKQKTFKYNKTPYYYIVNDYIYVPSVDWPAIRVEGLFRSGMGDYNCDIEHDCIYRQDEPFAIPMYIYAEMEQNVMKDLTTSLQVPQDINQDLLSNTK
jgi:hypothetical protein